MKIKVQTKGVGVVFRRPIRSDVNLSAGTPTETICENIIWAKIRVRIGLRDFKMTTI